jgi:Peptidase family S41
MSEKIYACLLRLYPARFRQEYGEEARRLFRDRLRDETGVAGRLRLWADLIVDLVWSLPGQYITGERGLVHERRAGLAGMPLFVVIEQRALGASALLSGCVVSLATLGLTTVLLAQAGTFHHHSTVFAASAFSQSGARQSTRMTDFGKSDRGKSTQAWVAAPKAAEFFPPPIDYMSLTNARIKREEQVFVYGTSDDSMVSSIGAPRGVTPREAATGVVCVPGGMLETGRRHVVDAVIANVKQHYFNAAMGQQMAEDLLLHVQNCDDAFVGDDKKFAALLTTQMRDVSHDEHLEVIYHAAPVSQPSPEEFAGMLAGLRKNNCSFKKIQILPGNIGYLRIDAFPEPAVCGSAAAAAMVSLNNADALIFDLRNNRGGTAEMVSFLSAYLFDHPEYMFDPRRIPSEQSWTASPVPGSRLADKPVYILTSSTTISAAEQFTYDLKMLKRATVVGETTAGGAHAGVWHRIDEHFAIAIPETRSVNPYAKADWEASGIEPDIRVPAPNALQAALKQACTRTHKN